MENDSKHFFAEKTLDTLTNAEKFGVYLKIFSLYI